MRVVLLPPLLALATVTGLGSYCETSDDTSLAWLFSGVLAGRPVLAVPLYLHGYGHLLAAVYAAVPGGPWLGLLLGGLLSLATVFVFAVLDRLLRPYLRPGPLALTLVGFFFFGWLEHWLWFSFGRVALLLAGAAVLFAAQRPGRRGALLLGLVALVAAGLLRPGLAGLSFVVLLPAARLLAGSWRRTAPLLISAALGLGLVVGAAFWFQAPAAARTQERDGYFARILDYDQLRPQPRTPADSLGTAAISAWLLGDSTVVNAALCRRAYHFDAPDFCQRTVPAKLSLRVGLLGRDYFPLLLALVATVIGARGRGRRGFFWLVQLGYVGALLVLAGLFKLPPRLALPLLDFWLLTNLIFLLRNDGIDSAGESGAGQFRTGSLSFSLLVRRLAAGSVLVVGLLYGAKTWHRRQVLGQEQSRHERAWAEISRATGGHVRVLAGTNDLLKSLSPFRVYDVGPGPVLELSGWPAHDPSQARLRQRLTGTPDQTEALRRLAGPGRDDVRWLLSAETARWLNRRFRYAPGPGSVVELRPRQALTADSSLRYYQPSPR